MQHQQSLMVQAPAFSFHLELSWSWKLEAGSWKPEAGSWEVPFYLL
jgi:hypothetical protein